MRDIILFLFAFILLALIICGVVYHSDLLVPIVVIIVAFIGFLYFIKKFYRF